MDIKNIPEGYYVCPQCNGTGSDYTEIRENKKYSRICDKCNGGGIIDWITMILPCKHNMSTIREYKLTFIHNKKRRRKK